MIFVGGRDLGEPAPTRRERLRNLHRGVLLGLPRFLKAVFENIRLRKEDRKLKILSAVMSELLVVHAHFI
jgi:hypothetical protein